MILKGLVVGSLGCNCYIVGCEKTHEGAIIDPGGSAKAILDLTRKLRLHVKYIINTHGHGDHTGANRKIKADTGAKILIHEKDAPMISRGGINIFERLNPGLSVPSVDRCVKDGDVIKIGSEIELKVIHTPGHTPGGICLKTGNIIFCGDTLFAGSVGRTDLPGGSFKSLIKSIKEKLLYYDDATLLYPGHGPSTTIGKERKRNPFLKNL